LTIFLSRSLADELVQRQILLVMTKPVPRWQYVLGKWVGMSILNTVLLSGAGLAVYGMVHYIKYTHPPIDDRYDEASLENEVLVARHALKCRPPYSNFTRSAELEFERNVEEGLYDNLPIFNPAEEKARLAKKYEAKWRVVGPSEMRVFEFANVLCDRSPDNRIQISYKTDVSQFPQDEIFRALWQVGDPTKGTPVYSAAIRHVVGRYHTIDIPADAVAPDHTLTVYFHNENPFPGEPQYNNVIEFRKASEVEVLFVVGSFEWNLVRLLVLMLCKLMFLAAVALLMTTVFSFPVACLVSFTVYVLAGAQSFITDALDFSSDDFSAMFSSLKEFALQMMTHIYTALQWVIPDFARYDAVETFVNGRNVSLVWVLQALFWLVLIKTAVVLGLAILLFHRREVAEVSV
jgi:hypothetical protein